MQTKYLCVLIHIWIKGEVGAPLNRFKPSSKMFYWPFQGGTSFVDLLCFCSVLCLLCLCVRLFICALWSPAGKGLTSWLSFVVSNCEFVTFLLVSWVGCGTWLYRLLIFAPLLILISISTAAAAPPGVYYDLINSREKWGNIMMTSIKGSLNYSLRP